MPNMKKRIFTKFNIGDILGLGSYEGGQNTFLETLEGVSKNLKNFWIFLTFGLIFRVVK